MKRALWLVLFLTLLCGCSILVKNPVVTVRGLNAVSLDPGGAGMELLLSVKNPNPYDLKLLGYSYDLKVMTMPLASGGVREEISFPAQAETEVRIPIRVSYRILVDIFKRRPDPDRIPYTLQAGLDLSTPLGKMNIPVNRTGTYAVPPPYRPDAVLKQLGDFFKFGK